MDARTILPILVVLIAGVLTGLGSIDQETFLALVAGTALPSPLADRQARQR